MLRILKLVLFTTIFFPSGVFAGMTEHKLAAGECVSEVVWTLKRDPNFWRDAAVRVLHPVQDVEYSKDEKTMRRLPVGSRVQIRVADPVTEVLPVSIPAIQTAPQVTNPSQEPISTVEKVSPTTGPIAGLSHEAAIHTVGLNNSEQSISARISTQEWMILAPFLAFLGVCAIYWANEGRKHRQLPRVIESPRVLLLVDPTHPPAWEPDTDLSDLDRIFDEPEKPFDISPTALPEPPIVNIRETIPIEFT